MKQLVVILLAIATLACAFLGLPVFFGIWMPDVIFSPQRTLAEQLLTNGHSYHVVQYWNGHSYNTELLHILPDDTAETHELNNDDKKSWSASLVVDERRKAATVTWSHGRVKTITW